MFSANELFLITGAVDGILVPSQEIQLRELLARSIEAQETYTLLLSQRDRVARLPIQAAPSSLWAGVMAQIEDLPRVEPVRPAAVATSRHRPWLAYTIAASTLFAISAGSFWASSRQADRQQASVQKQQLPRVTPDRTTGSSAVPAESPVIELVPPPREVASVPAPAPSVAQNTPSELAPAPRTRETTIVASGMLNDSKPFESIQLRLPFLAQVSDLDKPEVRAQVVEELGEQTAYRLDLFSRDSLKAAELLQAAAKAGEVNLVIDATAQDRLRKRQPTAWVVYSESLCADDIAGLLTHLARANRDTDRALAFTSAHLSSAQTMDQRELRELLGVDPGLWKRPKTSSSPKPISAGTVDQLAATLQKPGKGSDKSALFLGYGPPATRANPQTSREIRSFLERRDERKPSSLPILIVIRPAA